MPVYDIEANGKTYEVEAPSPQAAYDAMLQAGLIGAPEEGPVDLSDEIPQVTDFEQYQAEGRQDLEAQLGRDQQAQAAAQENLEFAEAPASEQMFRTTAQIGAEAGVLPRMVLDGLSGGYNEMIKPSHMPDINIAEYLGLGHLGAGQYVPEGSVADTSAELGGILATMGPGMVPVVRNQAATGSAIADMFGIGFTKQADDLAAPMLGVNQTSAANIAARSQEAIPAMHRNAELDGLARTDVDWNNTEQVQMIFDDINTETAKTVLTGLGDDYDRLTVKHAGQLKRLEEAGHGPEKYEKLKKNLIKKQEKEMDALNSQAKSSDLGQAMNFGDEFHNGVINTLARAYDMTIPEATAMVTKHGGVHAPDSFQALMETAYRNKNRDMFTVKDAFSGSKAQKYAENLGWKDGSFARWEEAIRPTVALVRENVGAGAANRLEAGAVRGAAERHEIVGRYNAVFEETQEIYRWADTPEIKRQFMDLHLTGREGRDALIQQARAQLDDGAFETFLMLVDDSRKHQTTIGRRVRADQAKDDVHWGVAKKAERAEAGTPEEMRGRIKRGENLTIGQLSRRRRKAASEMTDEELAEYENVIVSNFDQMFNDLDMAYIGDALDIPPNLMIDDNLATFVTNAGRHVKAVTGSDAKAAAFERALDAVIVGGRKTQNPWVTSFMNQSYAGSLGQFGSAMLQLHDQFITAWRTSPADALASITVDLLDKNRIKPQQFGLATDAFNTREFREGLDAGFLAKFKDKRTKGELVAAGTARAADVYFKISAFQAIDRMGKGGNMRATYRHMQRLLKRDDGGRSFQAKYGDLMTPRELVEVRGAMRNGTKFDKLSDKQKDIMGRALISRLGQQQLISQASRPIAYLNDPKLRPLYAMRGFAIVQQDLMKQEFVDELAKGNLEKAGTALAGYMAAVVGGYLITDTGRDALGAAASAAAAGTFTSGPDEVSPKQAIQEQLSMEKMGERASEAVFGPLTLNVLGDNYTNQSIKRDGLEAIAQKAIPAMGVAGDLFDAGVGAYLGNEERVMKSLMSTLPGFGRDMARTMKLHYEGDMVYNARKRIDERNKRREREQEKRRERYNR